MRMVTTTGLAMAAIAPLCAHAADLPASLECNAEIVVSCGTKRCDMGTYAVIHLDFRKNEIHYCRGERCDDTSITVLEQQGEWNKQRYLMFTGDSEDTGPVHGIVSLSDMIFRADGDAGDMFGSCKPD